MGPHVMGLIENRERMQFLSTIGRMCLMFSVGLENEFRTMGELAGA